MSKNKTNEIVISSSNKYNEASQRFRDIWNEYQDQEDVVKVEISNMVTILEKEGLSRMKAIQKIINDHNDLKGFSKASIYRELPEDMKDKTLGRGKKPLGQPNFSNEKLGRTNMESQTLKDFREQKGTKLQNKVIEHDGDTCHTNVPEYSSSTEVEADEGTLIIYDPKFVDNLIQVNAKYEELIVPFESRIMATVKGQDIPFIVKVDPYKRVVTSLEVDEKEAKKLNRF